MKNLAESNKLYEQAIKTIPWGTQTNAKRPNKDLDGVCPHFIRRGKGCHIWDTDCNEYIDFMCALGPIILGYADDNINDAVKQQIELGTMYNMAHPIEVELAELIARNVPCADRVRYLKSGADANSAAVRIARTYTGKDKVISIGYHGWHDTVNAKQGYPGIPPAARDLMFNAAANDLDGLKQLVREHKDEVAILIMDLAMHRDVDIDYLRDVRALTSENGILLAFDEIITGFRYAVGGAQAYFGVTPDLAAFGKGMANGWSIAALCGKAAVMDEGFEKTIISGTYYGSTPEIAAAIACITKLERENVPEKLWLQGDKLKNFINGSARRNGVALSARGPACIFDLRCDDNALKISFLRKLFEKGVFPGASYWFMQHSHTDEELDATFEIIDQSLAEIG